MGTETPVRASSPGVEPGTSGDKPGTSGDEPGTPGRRARLERHDPFWAPQLLIAGAIALDFGLPKRLAIGPVWLLPGLEALVLIGLLAASPNPRLRHSALRRHAAITLIALVSAVNAVSVFLLCHELLHSRIHNGRQLIFSGILLWATNVLLFGLWYWEIDGGGPLHRATHPEMPPDFLFPQMSDPRYAPSDWHPGLTDYLYVSFTNATAFSPTDTMPLTHSAKWLMSAQSFTALVTVGIVVARAVNILN